MFLREPKSLCGRRLQWNTRTPLFMVGLLFSGSVKVECDEVGGSFVRRVVEGGRTFVIHFKVFSLGICTARGTFSQLRTGRTYSRSQNSASLPSHIFQVIILRFPNATFSCKRDRSSLNDSVTCRHYGNQHKYCPAWCRCKNKS